MVSGGAGISGNTNIGGIVNITSTTASTNSSTGALLVSGGAGISGNTNIGGIVKINSIAVSTSIATGALVVSGGVGIAGNINIGGSILVNGNPLITSTATTFSVTGDVDSTNTTTGALKVTGGVGITRNVYVGGTTNSVSFNATSDYRIKSNIQSLDSRFTVDSLNPVTYYNTLLKKQDIGLIAHEVQQSYPYLVNGEKDGTDYQSINYIGLIGILIKEIQEWKKESQALQQRIQVLENR